MLAFFALQNTFVGIDLILLHLHTSGVQADTWSTWVDTLTACLLCHLFSATADISHGQLEVS